MGYKFTLVLSREITEEESVTLREMVSPGVVFGNDTFPTNAEIPVTKMDFDDTNSPSLAESIESALEAVRKVADLTVPGLSVPAQPAGPETEESKVVVGEVVAAGTAVEEPDAQRKSRKKASAKKKAAENTPDLASAAATSD